MTYTSESDEQRPAALSKAVEDEDKSSLDELLTKLDEPAWYDWRINQLAKQLHSRHAISWEDAEDCAQQSIVEMLDYLRRHNPRVNLDALLYRVANRSVVNFLRRRKSSDNAERIYRNRNKQLHYPTSKRRRTKDRDNRTGQAAQQTKDDPTVKEVEQEELRSNVECALRQLPKGQRQVLALWRNDFSLPEIGRFLQISRNAAQLRFQRALKALRANKNLSNQATEH